jgi:hypothetical protein
MDSKSFGPALWHSMFVIACNYPEKINLENRLDVAKVKYNKDFFVNLGNVIPCIYCRRSYKVFLKQLNINKYLHSRQALLYFVYLLKDLVNKKLNAQLDKSDKTKRKKSPPFVEVCQYYEQFRAVCSKKTLSCVKPIIK